MLVRWAQRDWCMPGGGRVLPQRRGWPGGAPRLRRLFLPNPHQAGPQGRWEREILSSLPSASTGL